MTREVWKFEIGPAQTQLIQMPRGAKILTVQTQGDSPFIWVEVDPSAPTEIRQLDVYGTGWLIPEPLGDYIGTFMVPGFTPTSTSHILVWHLYDRGPVE